MTLFRRGARKITLTNEGMLLRRRAEEILSLVDRTEKELLEQDEQIEGRVIIGSGEIAAIREMPAMIEKFREKYPLVTFEILTGTADLIKEQMEKGLIDIGVLLEPVDMEKFDFIRLKDKERWVALMRPDDPLAKKKTVSAKNLKNAPLILPKRANVRNEIISWLGDYYDEGHVIITGNLATNTALMVQQGLAYSLVIEGAVPFWDKEQIVSRPLSPKLTANSVFAWKKQQPFSPAATKFIEHMKYLLSIGEL